VKGVESKQARAVGEVLLPCDLEQFDIGSVQQDLYHQKYI
jgi:hypothetical protein